MVDILASLKKDPTSILENLSNSQNVLDLIKSLLDPISKGNSVLDEIYVDGLDATQVWPQAKMILESATERLMFDTIPALKEKNGTYPEQQELQEPETEDEKVQDDNALGEMQQNEVDEEGEHEDEYVADINGHQRDYSDEEDENNEDDEEDENDEDDEEGFQSAEEAEQKLDVHGLNDGFFSIDDFNRQILEQENENNDDEDIDYFGDVPDSEDEEILYHNDFFDEKQKTKLHSKKQANSKKHHEHEDDEAGSEGELNEDDYDVGMKSAMNDLYHGDAASQDEKEDEIQKQRESEVSLSSFERQQLKIQKEIQQLEKEAIAEKKWALKGEVKAKDRPADALLSEELEFERTAKPVPVITQEVTETLEDLIRRRIKENNFDDLPRRIISDVTNFRPSSTFELSETKSSKSLAELYEDDYKGEKDNAISEELQKSHDEIKELFKSISHKLDALSSAHFIPKPAQKSIDIKVNASTITMEDAQPLTISNSNTLAPQEVYKATRSGNDNEISLKSGAVVSRDELSREDKQRLRRANKRKRSKDFKGKEQSTKKKSKKQDVIDTLSKANNVTIIGDKGEKRDTSGNLKKDKVKQGTPSLKL